ncbi:hypothetical protein PC9H_004679 [Pleurotus ostreatus]|uniref:C2H2-type domain-containing protein n=1 Tax=Pleurotus ostreatus TaxID=5322 RepID=A0A8H6ZY56_PLEOS|nr:uncharacterized protein PC9H_004679 [Pleurotus ostreatus]KAF7432736.1 hypothetical protein PC9H_004679 [Pleurotus ostreatus]KAJ8698729.1 hypothetical protein PTI98_005403 [Pleurotus ostreatus]
MSNDNHDHRNVNPYAALYGPGSNVSLPSGLPLNVPNNALALPMTNAWPVVDHEAKALYDRQIQAMQAQLDAFKSTVDSGYSHYTALEKMVESGERAKQELARLRSGPAYSPTVQPHETLLGPRPSARIEELPSPGTSSRLGPSHRTQQQHVQSQLFHPPPQQTQQNSMHNPYPSQQRARLAQPIAQPYMPFNQRPQSGLSPQYRAPGPSSVNTSHVNPASVSGQRWPPQGIHIQGAPIAAQPQTNISITEQSSFSSLKGALGPKAASTPSSMGKPAKMSQASSSSSASALPTWSSQTQKSSTRSALPEEEAKQWIPSLVTFLEQELPKFAATGRPKTYYCDMQTIRVYKDELSQVWVTLTANGVPEERYKLEELTKETLLRFLTHWKRLVPGAVTPAAKSTTSSTPQLSSTFTPSGVAKPSQSTDATKHDTVQPTSSAKPSNSSNATAADPIQTTPAKGKKAGQLARDILRALGKTPPTNGPSGNSVTSKKQPEKSVEPGATASSSVNGLQSFAPDMNVDDGVIPPIAHLSPTPSSPGPHDEASAKVLATATTIVPEPLPPHIKALPQPSSSDPVFSPTSAFASLPLRPMVSRLPSFPKPTPQLQPYGAETNQFPSSSGIALPPQREVPKKRPRSAVSVEIPIKSPPRSPKKKPLDDVKTPLFLRSSSSPVDQSIPDTDMNFHGPPDTPTDFDGQQEHGVAAQSRKSGKLRQVEVVIPPPPPYVARYLKKAGKRQAVDRNYSISESTEDTSSRRESAGADSIPGSVIEEYDLEESKMVWEAGEKARRRPCMWKECDMILNSAKTLLAHLRRFHGDSVELGGDESVHICSWHHCGQIFADQESFFKHIDRHAWYPLCCIYEGCDETSRSTRQLRHHYETSHKEGDAMKPTPDPFPRPSLAEPPALPPTIPPYILAARVIPATISQARHNTLGPWVLRRLFPPVNVRPKRHHRGAIRLSTDSDNPYEFLSGFSRPAKVPQLEDLNSAEVSLAAHNGMSLQPSSSSSGVLKVVMPVLDNEDVPKSEPSD